MAARRVVTGNNLEGKSYFVHDGPTPSHIDSGFAIDDEIWVDDPANPDPTVSHDPVIVEKFCLEPPINGSVFRVVTLQPQTTGMKLTREAFVTAAARFDLGEAIGEEDPEMHTTSTIDYGIVLSGEIDLELDEGEVQLTAGDVVVQRGTRHAWRNRGSEPCTIAFVLVSSPNYR